MPELQIQESRKYSQTEAARRIGVTRQALGLWRADGKLRPKKRKGRRKLVYTEHDIVCGVFCKGLTEQLGFQGAGLAKIVRFAQTGTEEELRNALILTARTDHGMMRHSFVRDRHLNPANVCQIYGVEGDFENTAELIGHLKTVGRFVDAASVWDLLEQIRRGMAATDAKVRLGEATEAAGNEAC